MYNYLLSKLKEMESEDKEKAKKAAARLRLTVSGSAACPVPIMNQWEEISGSQASLAWCCLSQSAWTTLYQGDTAARIMYKPYLSASKRELETILRAVLVLSDFHAMSINVHNSTSSSATEYPAKLSQKIFALAECCRTHAKKSVAQCISACWDSETNSQRGCLHTQGNVFWRGMGWLRQACCWATSIEESASLALWDTLCRVSQPHWEMMVRLTNCSQILTSPSFNVLKISCFIDLMDRIELGYNFNYKCSWTLGARRAWIHPPWRGGRAECLS